LARQTRAQRRARRQQSIQEPALAGAGGGGSGGKPPVAVAPEPPSRGEPSRREAEPRRGPFASFRRFLAESWGELRKTEWPNQNQVIQGTIVVLIACAIMGTFIWLADIASKHIVQNLLLR
jgi:preprotein translocase SecE subunit